MNHFIESSRQRRRVLVVDDEVINRELLEAILSLNYDVSCASNGSEAMRQIRSAEEPFSLILLDLLMPQKSGFQVLEECRTDEELKKIPIIVMTSEKSAEVRSIHMGADDFIPKPYRMPEVILARCERIIELSEEKSLISSIEIDEATGLYDKSFFYAYIRRLLSKARFQTDAVIVRVDGFTQLVKRRGHTNVDMALRRMAELITRELIGTRGIACYAGFGVFGVYCKHREDYEEVFERIRKELDEYPPSKGVRFRVGICAKVDKAKPMESWFSGALTACKHVSPPARTALYTDELRERDARREHLSRDLKELTDSQVIVRFQPRYRLENGAPVPAGANAFPCWRHPLLGVLSADELVPIARKEGILKRLDRITFREAAAAARSCGFPVAVEVGCAEGAEGIIDELAITPSDVIPSFNEALGSDDDGTVEAVIKRLKDKGFTVEMNGFGTGGTPVYKLAELHIDALMADPSIKGESLCTVLRVAKLLVRDTIVGGVETAEQLEALVREGCSFVQGDYLSLPVSADELTDIVKSR